MKKLFFVIIGAILSTGVALSAYAAEEKPATRVIAYYFHGTMRCPTCHKLEQYSKEAIEENFKDALASGKLEFRIVNIEDKGNEHYGKDYQLYTKSLVLSLVKDGKEIKWKNMDKVWEYVGNKGKFIDYVKSGTTEFLKEAQ